MPLRNDIVQNDADARVLADPLNTLLFNECLAPLQEIVDVFGLHIGDEVVGRQFELLVYVVRGASCGAEDYDCMEEAAVELIARHNVRHKV